MTAPVLVAYATRYGSTREVADKAAQALWECGLAVSVQPARDVRTLDGYSAVLLGAPLYMFRWHKDARRFLSRHRKALSDLPVAIFALGPVHEPHDEAEWEDSHAQLDRELANYPWLTPVALELFGGKYDPANLRFPLNLLVGKEAATDIRDWEAIHTWASALLTKLGPAQQ